MNHPKKLEFAVNLAKDAGKILLKHFGKITSIDRKSSDIDLVTLADTKSEEFIIENIHSFYPEHHIIAEESDLTETGALVGLYRHLGNNVKLGLGYEWGEVSDDMANISYEGRGVFLNLIAKF